MLQATARWEAFFSQIFPSESPCHYLGEFAVMHFITIICLLLLESLPKIWLLHLDYVLVVDPFDNLSTWKFLKFLFLLTSSPSWSRWQWHPSCVYEALHFLHALLCSAPDICSCSSSCTTWSPPSSSQTAALVLAVSWLQRWGDDYFGWVKHFPSLKQIWSWIQNTSRSMNSTMILLWNHGYEFIYEIFMCEFISRNLAMISRYSS